MSIVGGRGVGEETFLGGTAGQILPVLNYLVLPSSIT